MDEFMAYHVLWRKKETLEHGVSFWTSGECEGIVRNDADLFGHVFRQNPELCTCNVVSIYTHSIGK